MLYEIIWEIIGIEGMLLSPWELCKPRYNKKFSGSVKKKYMQCGHKRRDEISCLRTIAKNK